MINYFYIENISGKVINLNIADEGFNLQYSTHPEYGTWINYNFNFQPNFNKKVKKIYFRGTNTHFRGINCSENFNVGGDITTLLSIEGNILDLTQYNNCFDSLFSNSKNLISVKKLILPSTKLGKYSYANMFNSCVSLVDAPELISKKLEQGCYANMFTGCKSLIQCPELNAQILKPMCYNNMFLGCTSLVTPPLLNSTRLAPWCYDGMFNNCISLKTAPELPATTLANNCYNAMFYMCTSLNTAPVLPATNLMDECYRYMFYGCKNLQYIKTQIDVWNVGNNSTLNWVYGVSPTGTFEKKSSTSIPIGVNGIPDGWVIKDIDFPKIKSNKHIQLKRNKVLYNSKDEIIGVNGVWKNIEFIKQLRDGEIILGRYKENTKVHTILGIVNIIKSGDVISNESFIYSFEKIININNNINNNTHDIILDENLNGNRKAIKILKNKDIFKDKDEIIGPFGLWNNFGFIKQLKDGEMVIGRYNNNNGKVKTIIGVSYINYINGEIDKESYIEYFI